MNTEDFPSFNYWLAAAWNQLPWEESEAVYERLRRGVKLNVDEEAGVVTVRFANDEIVFVRMSLEQIRQPAPVFEYA